MTETITLRYKKAEDNFIINQKTNFLNEMSTTRRLIYLLCLGLAGIRYYLNKIFSI